MKSQIEPRFSYSIKNRNLAGLARITIVAPIVVFGLCIFLTGIFSTRSIGGTVGNFKPVIPVFNLNRGST